MKTQWMVGNKIRSTFLITVTVSIFAFSDCSVIGQKVPVDSRIQVVSGDIKRGEKIVGNVIFNDKKCSAKNLQINEYGSFWRFRDFDFLRVHQS